MGKYTSSSRRPPVTPRDRTPPLMRGIGCILFVLVPFVSYGLAAILVKYGGNRGWPIPATWYGPPRLPAWLTGLNSLDPITNFLAAQNNLTANLVFTIFIAVVIFGIMSVVYGYVFAMVGPSQYGPLDVPPPRVKTKKFRR